jgi:hypothetical protein
MLETMDSAEEYERTKTYVRFVNNGPFPVDVFSDPERSAGKICSVNPRDSQAAEVFPEKDSNTYYLIYRLTFHNAKIPYNGSMTLHIPEGGGTTEGRIPLLSDSENKASPITNAVYIYMNNTASNSLRLQRGNTPITLDGSSSYVLNGNSSGMYILRDQFDVSSYAFSNADTGSSFSWPYPMGVSFERGYLYSFSFSGGNVVSFIDKWEITLDNILAPLLGK